MLPWKAVTGILWGETKLKGREWPTVNLEGFPSSKEMKRMACRNQMFHGKTGESGGLGEGLSALKTKLQNPS